MKRRTDTALGRVAPLLLVILAAAAAHAAAVQYTHYTVEGEGGRTCVKVDVGRVILDVEYQNKTGKLMSTSFLVVSETEVWPWKKSDNMSMCDGSAAKLVLFDSSQPENSTTLYFSLDFTKGEKNWDLTTLMFNFSVSDFPNINSTVLPAINSVSYKNFFTGISFNKSIECNSTQELAFTDKSNFMVKLNTSYWKAQAFDFSEDGKFDSSQICPADKPSIIVPIVVGVALGVLVILVVVTWIIGKVINMRKSANSSYEAL